MDESSPRGYGYSEEPSTLYTIGKYWVHGFLYQIATTLILIPVLISLIFLVLLTFVVGLIIGLALLFLAIGWINKVITGYLWKIECRGAWTSLIGHGLLLMIGLLIIGFPMLFIQLFFYYSLIPYYIISYGPIPIIQGYIAKAVAKYFEEGIVTSAFPSGGRRTPVGPLTTCPYCNAVFPYREIDITVEGTAPCRSCGAIIQDPRYRPGGPKRSQRPRDWESRPPGNQDDAVWG